MKRTEKAAQYLLEIESAAEEVFGVLYLIKEKSHEQQLAIGRLGSALNPEARRRGIRFAKKLFKEQQR